MTLLQEYIVQQPALWRALLDSREEITGAFARRFGDLRPDRVVLIGSGSSHYAALMARPVLERAWGAEVTCLVPSEAAGTRLTGERPLYLAISQSGGVDSAARLDEDILQALVDLRAACALGDYADLEEQVLEIKSDVLKRGYTYGTG